MRMSEPFSTITVKVRCRNAGARRLFALLAKWVNASSGPDTRSVVYLERHRDSDPKPEGSDS